MKKYFLILLMIGLGIILLQGCSNQNENVKRINKIKKDYFVYHISETISDFSVDENGIVYYATTSRTEEEHTSEMGEVIKIPSWETMLFGMNASGELIKSLKLPFGLSNKFCILNNKLYYYETVTDKYNKLTTTIKVYDLEMEVGDVLAVVKDVGNIKNFVVLKDGIYFLGEDINLQSKSHSLADPMDHFFYEGEIIAYLDLSTLEMKKLDIEFPISFSSTLDGQAVVYAYDEEKGYYFTKYYWEKDEISPPVYKNLRNLMGFACSRDTDVIFYNSPTLAGGTIAATSISKNETTELMFDVSMDFRNLYVVEDYLYYKNNNNNQIERIKYEDYMTENKSIHMISSVMEAFLPFGGGYKLNRDFLSPEAFSLSVLSNDSDVDLFVLSSWDEISDNIKRKGIFYPLNEVDGVKEYLEALFPYVSESATTLEGEVWMLPISVDIPFFVYDEEVCNINGVDFSKDLSMKDFSSIIRHIQKDDVLRNKMSYSDYTLVTDILNKYTREYKIFDEEAFISLAKEIKDNFNYMEKNTVYNNFALRNELYFENQNKHLFALESNIYLHTITEPSIINPSLKACKLPFIGKNKKSVGTSIFLAVNPTSKNLEETLDYVSVLCRYLLQAESTRLFRKDSILKNSLEKEIHKIYENGDIIFTFPYDVYTYDFRHYLLGNMELLEMIKEADRKMDIYLKE